MPLYKKYIEPPVLNVTQQVYDESVKKFFLDLHDLMISAGYIKSNTVNNMDFNNIHTRDISILTPGGYYSPSYVEYDLNDSRQTILPVRIRIEFGLYRSNVSSIFISINIFRTSIGLINENNELYNTKAFSNMYMHVGGQTPTISSPGSVMNSYYDSYATSRDNIYSCCIVPEYGQSYTQASPPISSLSPIVEFVIERISDTEINVYASSVDIMAGSGYIYDNTTMTKNITTSSNSFYIYNNINTYLTKGKLNVYPVFNVYSDRTLKQSKNIILCKDNAIGPTGSLELLASDEVTTSNFFALTAKSSLQVVSGARMMVRY